MTQALSLLDRPAQAVVRAVIRARLGTRSAVLVEFVGGEADPETGAADPVPLPRPIQLLPGDEYASKIGLDAATLVQRGEQAWLAELGDLEPTTAMRLRVSGAEWAISKAHAISSGERNVLWLLVVKGAS